MQIPAEKMISQTQQNACINKERQKAKIYRGCEISGITVTTQHLTAYFVLAFAGSATWVYTKPRAILTSGVA
jgi:hypothetical protein